MKNKITPISNSSLLGTVKYAVEKQNLSDLAENAEYIDLSLNPDFNDLFKRLNDVGFDGALLLEVYKNDFDKNCELYESLDFINELAYKIFNK